MFGDNRLVSCGNTVTRQSTLVSIPTSRNVLGRVIDPLGNTLNNNKELIIATNVLPVDIKAVDTIFPIGKEQSELIIGDRQTGKTALLVIATF